MSKFWEGFEKQALSPELLRRAGEKADLIANLSRTKLQNLRKGLPSLDNLGPRRFSKALAKLDLATKKHHTIVGKKSDQALKFRLGAIKRESEANLKAIDARHDAEKAALKPKYQGWWQ